MKEYRTDDQGMTNAELEVGILNYEVAYLTSRFFILLLLSKFLVRLFDIRRLTHYLAEKF